MTCPTDTRRCCSWRRSPTCASANSRPCAAVTPKRSDATGTLSGILACVGVGVFGHQSAEGVQLMRSQTDPEGPAGAGPSCLRDTFGTRDDRDAGGAIGVLAAKAALREEVWAAMRRRALEDGKIVYTGHFAAGRTRAVLRPGSRSPGTASQPAASISGASRPCASCWRSTVEPPCWPPTAACPGAPYLEAHSDGGCGAVDDGGSTSVLVLWLIISTPLMDPYRASVRPTVSSATAVAYIGWPWMALRSLTRWPEICAVRQRRSAPVAGSGRERRRQRRTRSRPG